MGLCKLAGLDLQSRLPKVLRSAGLREGRQRRIPSPDLLVAVFSSTLPADSQEVCKRPNRALFLLAGLDAV